MRNFSMQARNRGSALTLFLILLLLIGLALAGWLGWQQSQRLTEETRTLRADIQALERDGKERQAKNDTVILALEQRLDRVNQEMAARDKALAALQDGGQRNWLLNETAALARLAQERLLLTGDVAAAQRLLELADRTLARINDPAVLPTRKILAADIQRLRGARQVDVQALMLQLGALQNLVAEIAVPVAEAPPDLAADKRSAGNGWWNDLLASLPLAVHRQGDAVPLPLDARQASLVRLALDNSLQQAQMALQQGRAEIYRMALGQAGEAARTWLAPRDPEVRQLLVSLEELKAAPVDQALPEIDSSLAAIQNLQKEWQP